MSTQSSDLKVEFLEADEHYIHGIINQTAPLGFGLMLDPAKGHPDDSESILIPADGVAGYQLQRDVVGNTTDAEKNVRMLDALQPQGFAKPEIVGATVAGRRVTRMVAEGKDLILTSGTGAVSTGTAVNTPLGYSQGRLRVKQTNDEIAFIVRAQIAPIDAANGPRLLLERP